MASARSWASRGSQQRSTSRSVRIRYGGGACGAPGRAETLHHLRDPLTSRPRDARHARRAGRGTCGFPRPRCPARASARAPSPDGGGRRAPRGEVCNADNWREGKRAGQACPTRPRELRAGSSSAPRRRRNPPRSGGYRGALCDRTLCTVERCDTVTPDAVGTAHLPPVRRGRTRPAGRAGIPPGGDDPLMTFRIRQWRWRLSPAGRRARKANAARVALLTSTKRTA